MEFTKLQAQGNDFVLLDCREGFPDNMERLARALCDRRHGPGADGVLCLSALENGNWNMRIFNADGSEAETCGNGLRCVGRWLDARGLLAGGAARVETKGGLRRVSIGPGGAVTADMGRPAVLGEHKIAVMDKSYTGTAVSMKNPHFIIPVRDISGAELEEIGPQLQTLAVFPEGTNVELVRLICPERIELRIWERGCGETSACGSGACAAAAALRACGALEDQVTVVMPGGRAEVRFDRYGAAALTGPAELVYEGKTAEGWTW